MKYSIGHLAYFVSDMQKTLDFYCGVLGFKVMFEQSREGDPIKTIYLRIGQGQFIELFVNPDRKITKSEEASFAHLCLHVDDIEAARAEIVAKGVEATPIRVGNSKSLLCFINDPDGNSIELMQRTEESLQTIHDHD